MKVLNIQNSEEWNSGNRNISSCTEHDKTFQEKRLNLYTFILNNDNRGPFPFSSSDITDSQKEKK